MKNELKQRFYEKSHLRLYAKFFLLGIFLLFQLSAEAQERTISGTVTGTDGMALAGINVVVKGTTTGSITDANGKFTLSVPASAQILTFSFIGMEAQEVTVTRETV